MTATPILTEADTCRELVTPKLLAAGWGEAPHIDYGNTLDQRIAEIGHSERVDLILTNPPFGGEEESGIKANFPANMQTAETALLFLQGHSGAN